MTKDYGMSIVEPSVRYEYRRYLIAESLDDFNLDAHSVLK